MTWLLDDAELLTNVVVCDNRKLRSPELRPRCGEVECDDEEVSSRVEVCSLSS
jgi:hypothetical protein